MSNIEVSVCVITYNQENYIRQCLDSIFMQKTTFDFEVIVAEDASPDNTRQILLEYKEKYGDKLVLVLHDENVGVSKNSLSAREKVRGKYIASCEGDDFWTDENKLQKQYEIMEANPQYSSVSSDFMLVEPDGKVILENTLNLKKDTVKNMKSWLKEGYSIHTCTMFSRFCASPFGDEKYRKLRTTAPTMGDVISLTTLYNYGDIYVLKDVMSAHRQAGANDTTSFSYMQSEKSIKYTQMYYNIVVAMQEYFGNKYDYMQLFVNRLASMKARQILGSLKFNNNEHKTFVKKLSLKHRIMLNVRVIKKLYKMVIKKLRIILKNRGNK